MWPFSTPTVETRSTNSETDILVEAIQSRVSGRTPDHAALATVEACSSLWERALASATMMPLSAALRPLTPDLLALVARGLASRGEFVAHLRVNEMSGLRIVPASGWDLRGDADPHMWRYRLDMGGPSGNQSTGYLNSDQVLHFRIGASPQEPWRGRSPLRRSRATADLAARIEGNLILESNIKPTRIASTAGTAVQAESFAKALSQGGLFGTAFGQPLAGQQVPSSRWEPAKMGPEPDETFHALRTQTGQDICAAFGVPPTLFNASGDGAGQREAWRRFWAGTIAPIGRVIESECKMKLDPAALVSFDALRASDEDGRSRAVSRRATAAKVFVDMGLDRDAALALAGLGD